jgi:hypothetical protein
MSLINLKKDVLFISVDGSIGDPNHVHQRLELQSKIKENLKYLGLRVITVSPIKKYGDINMVPYFGLNTDYETASYNYAFFLLKHLITYIKDLEFTHICIWQTDGYPINLNRWDDLFLNYDYIGYDNGQSMNGGFSLRSRNFIETVSNKVTPEIFNHFNDKYGHHNEDVISQSLDLHFKYPDKTIKDTFCKRISNCDDLSNIVNTTFGFHWDGADYQERLKLFDTIKFMI